MLHVSYVFWHKGTIVMRGSFTDYHQRNAFITFLKFENAVIKHTTLKFRDTALCPVTFDLSRLVCKVVKSISFLTSVRLSAFISEDPIGRI